MVITGIGIYSCIGRNVDEVRDSLYEGRSGVIFDPERKALGFTSGLTGHLTLPEVKQSLDRRTRQYLSEHGLYAYVATEEALRMAGLDRDYFREHVAGIFYGNDSSTQATKDAFDRFLEKGKSALIGSSYIFQSMNSTLTMNLSTIYGLRGVNMSISSACASGSHSVGLGYHFIRHGYEDCIICGGAEEVNPWGVLTFDALSVFSQREDDPMGASRPFDTERDGLVPSGGAATLILESLESAKKRGAPILAEVLGVGFSSNGRHISTPNVEGPSRALVSALKDAGVTPADIEYINAHATSTPVGDYNEGKAILEIFGEDGPWVSSTKSLTGHEMWMAGASEIIYSLLMQQGGFIAGTRNFTRADEGLEQLKVSAERIEKDFDLFVSNSFGFGGTNSALVVRRYRE